MRRHAHSSRLWIAGAVIAAVTVVTGTALLVARAAQDPADKSAQFAAAMQDGNQALAQRKYLAAIDAFKKANDLKGKQSPEAFFSMSRAYFAMSAFKDAAEACTNALKFSGDDKRLQGQMRYMRGLSLVALGIQKDTDREFKDAEADFRATIELTDKVPLAQFQLGSVLLRQKRDAEGISELGQYVAMGGNAPEVEEAKRMIANPRRARESYAPEFALTSLQGELIQLKELQGKAVLLDFWGTWCGPCRAATPDIVKFYKKHEKDPFVMIGVAVNDKNDLWKAYVKEHDMAWPQYFDTGSKIARMFQVTAFPTYIILDGDGVIKARQLGWGPGTTGALEYEIKQAMKSGRHEPAPLFAKPER